MTRARDGKKRIVWRCVSRLEFGTRYCHNSPTLDESKLHSAIFAAMNESATIRQEACPDVLAMAKEAKQALSQAGAVHKMNPYSDILRHDTENQDPYIHQPMQ